MFLPWPKCLSEPGWGGKRWLFLVWGLPKLVGGCMMSAGQTASKLLPTSGWWSPNDALANIDRADHNAMHSPNAPTRHHVQPGFAKEPLHVFPPKYSWQTHRSKLRWELGGRWLQLVREPPEPPWSLSDGIPVKREGVIRSPSLLLPMRTCWQFRLFWGFWGSRSTQQDKDQRRHEHHHIRDVCLQPGQNLSLISKKFEVKVREDKSMGIINGDIRNGGDGWVTSVFLQRRCLRSMWHQLSISQQSVR